MTNQKYIHPFPARMAPEIAIHALKDLQAGDIILDPMAGSGTVLHQAALKGFSPIGFDLDPLAVLMSRVATNKVDLNLLQQYYISVAVEVDALKLNDFSIPWIDEDEETAAFIRFWFAPRQLNALRKLAFVLSRYQILNNNSIEVDALRLALSRIIITKKIGASLAWDISHSRPHKKRDDNDYNVMEGYADSVDTILKYLEHQEKIALKGEIKLGDARSLSTLRPNSVDKVITSPPYLNAIDYLRGSKFSLVWLGYSIPKLREIRSNAIGAEKRLSYHSNYDQMNEIYTSLFQEKAFEEKQNGMIKRYINDSISLMSEISRVLKHQRRATLVVGNSTLKGVYISNSEIFRQAGTFSGLNCINERIREIPVNQRYLPVPDNQASSLGKRMKEEVIMTFLND